MQLRILYQDTYLIAVDKPAGFHVHPPEDQSIRIRASTNCLAIVRNQIGQFLYPVHRLDCPTSGVLLYALDSETAREMARLFQNQEIKKTYYCVVRGWMKEEETINRPLTAESDPTKKIPASTHFQRLTQIELPFPVGRYSTARYSLLRAEPATGRFHQIRRHLAGHSHPIIGDTIYGDSAHNRFVREHFGARSLFLKAQAIRFTHPRTGELLTIQSRWHGKWHQIFDQFGICPFDSR